MTASTLVQARDQARSAVADAVRVARFIRGLAEFQARPEDVFISSYPRSGTTWMQHIVHALRSGGDMRFRHISDVAPWFERPLALGRQRAHDYAALESPRIFKSHLPRSWLPRGARYIYVQRDGRDVALSYYWFYRSHLGYHGDFDAFFERFLAGTLQYGSWFKHVADWQPNTHDPALLVVHYEQLRSDLPRELRRIAGFLGLQVSDALSERLCALCDFEFMRMNEAKFDHAAAEPGSKELQPGSFIRSGTSGQHRIALTSAQSERFIQHLLEPRTSGSLALNLPAFLH